MTTSRSGHDGTRVLSGKDAPFSSVFARGTVRAPLAVPLLGKVAITATDRWTPVSETSRPTCRRSWQVRKRLAAAAVVLLATGSAHAQTTTAVAVTAPVPAA